MLKILVVDEDKHLLRSLKFLLERRRYHVHTLATIHEVLPEALEFQPDLVLLGGLINGGGFITCKKLKAGPLHDTPVFMMCYSSSDEPMAYEAGAQYFIEKPFALQQLLSKIYLVSGALLN